ncbi:MULTISPECIES: sigma-54-dependent transcriptional regulator [unclassified Sedimentibacter]|uniref:sigma-54-dependent transcriptional regulator n=1 Tax=unclassified Sedimentibacter TaxID=2649220 RepID=UPI0027DFD358|nr:sigma-54 dependent transcriptional regulator [Sedimentibacter sp. MB35-C1]WMJ76873.1 sigma-54 dependent transcriptional regulator [Sedimentibacter sp. MB35-C1]
MKTKILIVDDENNILRALKFLLEDSYHVYTSDNVSDAKRIFIEEKISLVLLDLRLSEGSGLILMDELLAVDPNAVVIIMTAYSTIENSIKAIKSGAYYFITKPIDNDQLLILLNTAAEKLNLKKELDLLQGHLRKTPIGESKAILDIKSIVDKIKDTDATVLITGESGTGKELIAQTIHSSSNRAGKPFIAINCAAMPNELLESELFGYKKGSFTGATKDDIGLIRKAEKGTLFLDEIGEMNIKLQSKLLRFIQEKEIRHIGDEKNYPVDVRIICSTNRNLEEEIKSGNFREDLYYRINVINIVAPPLRERIEDLDLLVPHFIDKYRISYNKEIKGITDDAMNQLKNYEYLGNVRELENIIQRAVLLCGDEYIGVDSLNFNNHKMIRINDNVSDNYIKIYEGETLEDIEKKAIEFALKNNRQNRKWTANSLGISERSIRYKIKEYKL